LSCHKTPLRQYIHVQIKWHVLYNPPVEYPPTPPSLGCPYIALGNEPAPSCTRSRNPFSLTWTGFWWFSPRAHRTSFAGLMCSCSYSLQPQATITVTPGYIFTNWIPYSSLDFHGRNTCFTHFSWHCAILCV